MNKITQTARYRQSLILYAQKHGVTEAAKRYRTYRQYIYRWMKRYDGTLQSLEDHSHRPHSHPKQHQPEEIRLIDNMRRRNPNAGLVVFWVKLRQRGYSRSISGLYRFLRKRGQMAVITPARRSRSTSNTSPAHALSALLSRMRKKTAATITSIPSSTNTAAFGIWKPSKNTIRTLPRSSSSIVSNASHTPLNASKPTTAPSSVLTKRLFSR